MEQNKEIKKGKAIETLEKFIDDINKHSQNKFFVKTKKVIEDYKKDKENSKK